MITTDRKGRELLGEADLSDADVSTVAQTVLGDPDVEIGEWEVDQVAYTIGTPSTESLLRVSGDAMGTSGALREWSVFVKVLRWVGLWELLHVIPAEHQDAWLNDFPWRLDADAREFGIDELLPRNMRLPVTYRIDDLPGPRTAMWMEDVQIDESWTLERYESAAYGLGQLAARRAYPEAEPFPRDPKYAVPNEGLRYYVNGRVRFAMFGLGNDAAWTHPIVLAAIDASGDAELRADLQSLTDRVPELLAMVDALPLTYCHGDASPQNLLVPKDEPDTFVVIDFGFNSPHPVGFDLGQLLVGLTHAGIHPASALPTIADVIEPAYVDGMRAEGMPVSVDDVHRGFVASNTLRSAFTAVPFEWLDAPGGVDPSRLDAWCERIRLARYLVDTAATI